MAFSFLFFPFGKKNYYYYCLPSNTYTFFIYLLIQKKFYQEIIIYVEYVKRSLNKLAKIKNIFSIFQYFSFFFIIICSRKHIFHHVVKSKSKKKKISITGLYLFIYLIIFFMLSASLFVVKKIQMFRHLKNISVLCYIFLNYAFNCTIRNIFNN